MLNVMLIGHSTRNENLGVGALTVSQVAILRRLATEIGTPLTISVAEWRSPLPSYVTGPDIVLREMRGKDLVRPTRFLSWARAADLVIDIGAGDSFADIYGTSRLRRMFAMKYLVHLSGRPLVTAPQTLGPFTRKSSIALARFSLRHSAIAATRDRMSTDCARDMGMTEGIIEASDVALRLPYDTPLPRPVGGPPRVGLNVSGLLMQGGYTGGNEFGLKADYPAMIRTLIRRLQEAGSELHLVPHVVADRNGAMEDDYRPSVALAKEFPSVIVAPPFRDPSEAKTYIAGLDFFAGARMHACIAAFSSNVPVVPMAYSRKFAGMFGTLGYDHTVDCTTEAGEVIVEKVMAGLANRAALEADRKAALARGLEKLGLYETALRDLMASRMR